MDFDELSLLWVEDHQSEAQKSLLVRIPVTGTAEWWRPTVMS
jgi:hypothetical protein